jgi:hypothetical protein
MEKKGKSSNPLSDELMRFILTSIPSIPFLEALLLLRSECDREWNSKHVATRLYLSEKHAARILNDLTVAGFLKVGSREGPAYLYGPASLKQKHLVDQLAAAYASRLVEVSNLIHSETGQKAHYFGSAFKWVDRG